MGRISTGIGLISGINSRDVIDQLMELESRPKRRLEQQIETTNERKLAYVDLSTRLTSLKLIGTTLKKPSTFEHATSASSDENVLTATTQPGAAVGSYQFQVARLVTTQQTVSRGFADFDSARVGAGTLTVELGGGEISSQTLLSELRGGAGIRRGSFRITDRSGKSAVIDMGSAVTLDDVVKKINTALDISVKAQVVGDRLKLTDLTGSTASALRVEDLEGSFAAADLGLLSDSDGDANTITGSDIHFVSRSTALASLNDGRGVRKASSGTDFTITTGGGQSFNVSIAAAKTLGEVADAINTATGGVVKADIVPGGNGLRLTDTSNSGPLTVAANGDSKAALDLGIEGTAGGSVMTGQPLIAGINSVLIRSLNGGNGMTLGSFTIQDRSGASASVDLSSATSVQDILDAINNSGLGVRATLSPAGNGIAITDTTGDTGDIVITDSDGTNTATALGLGGTFGIDVTQVRGKNLQRQWLTENTLLKDMNGGQGIALGSFRITDSRGVVATITIDQNDVRLEDVIRKINNANVDVTASINANGDGLLLTDTGGGGMKLKVTEVEGTTAKELNILGEATDTTIDGSFEKTITVEATDTLQDVQRKINDLNWGVAAQIINDGTAAAPYRLSLSARNPGLNGRFTFDAGATGLETNTLVAAQNAAVFLGSAEAAQPLLVTSSTNNLSGVIRGVNIELQGISDRPVTLNISRTSDNVKQALSDFTEKFNEMVDKFKELTKFDPTTFERGLLLGDSTQSTIQTETYAMVNTIVSGVGRYRVLADVGLRLGDGAKLEFDEEKFDQAYNTDPEAVKDLFTKLNVGVGFIMEQRITKLTDPVSGVITRQNNSLEQRTLEFQRRIANMDKLLQQKRARLERQFAQLESVLAGLQSQQQAIGQITTIQAPSRSR